MSIKFSVVGFLAKIVTGFDDTIIHVPVIASVARSRIGMMAFSIGILMAILVAIVIASFFSIFLVKIPFYRYFAAGLMFVLAVAIYFDFFVHRPRIKAEKKITKFPQRENLLKLFGIGFIASFATVLDDIIVYTPLFVDGSKLFTAFGIVIATVVEILIIIYFAQRIKKMKYTDKIASIGLVGLGILILTGVV